MPWVVGIDEAGYGPNLGPLVQAAVALNLPDGDTAGWDTLKPVVRRCHEKADGRLLIDDSKKVYTRGGLEALERGVWSITAADLAHAPRLPLESARASRHGARTCALNRGSMAATRFRIEIDAAERMGRVRARASSHRHALDRRLPHRPFPAVQSDRR